MVLARVLISMALILTLSACQEQADNEVTPKAQPLAAVELDLPKPEDKPVTTDFVSLNTHELTLLDDAGGCKLQVAQQEAIWIKPTAPCYFMRSPFADKVQVFQKEKGVQVLAVVGTPAGKKERCGLELQGLIIRRKNVQLSENIQRGSIYCAANGLDNFQYSLF